MTRQKLARFTIIAGIGLTTLIAAAGSHRSVRRWIMRKRGFWRLFYSQPSSVEDGAGNTGRCASHGRLIGGLCCAPTQGPLAANAWIGKALAAVAQDWPTLVPNAGLAAGIGLAAGVVPAPAAAFSVICAAAPQPVACPASVSGYVVVTGGQIVVTGGSYAGTYHFALNTNDYLGPNGASFSQSGITPSSLPYAQIMSLFCSGKQWGSAQDAYHIETTNVISVAPVSGSLIYSETIPNYTGEPTGTLKFTATDSSGGSWTGTCNVAWQATAP